ncbi:hypothetical protein AAFF_G00075460 [Aldrovandia affinis]|uniref:WD repeat-containing protein on Y chromosome n=1 Tax=Aldrovandia affinis TaxID=143900 RepID=A0AAD7S0L7_9TELE|nr:hypothetical protein AAFF_G00075460 [Aldrovandia affinis]
MAKFREVMRKIGLSSKDEDLNLMFMKMDVNCDAILNWEEFKLYLLLENEARDSMHKSRQPTYFPEPIRILQESKQRSNCKAIVGLQFYAFRHPQAREQGSAAKLDEDVCKTRIEPGQYMSITQDGKLSYWTNHMKHMYTLKLDDLKQAYAVLYQKIWVLDMLCMRNIDLLAISSTSNHLEFYDISARKCALAFTLTGVEPVTVMDYWSDGKKAVYSIGDMSGCVTVFTSCDVVQYGIFNRRTTKTVGNGSGGMGLIVRLTMGGCSHSIFQLQKGIMCFDYSPELNILVTGGSDRIVRVWNPYVTKRACSQMDGHLSVITDVAINGRDKKVISISKDKNLRVWDLQNYTCLQKIRPSEVPMGRPPITAVHYMRETNTLVIATGLIGVLQGDMEDMTARDKESAHVEPACAMLYNTCFKQVVSGCYSGAVCVWDILTGLKEMEFQTCPERDTEMTAMSFDGSQRRLLTGFEDGTVRLWNFHNGAMLLKLPLLDKHEVTGILHVNSKIFVSGWNKRVICYKNLRKDAKMEHSAWKRYHTGDIWSMDAYGNKMLVTASYNGDIIIWNMGTEEPLCWFNTNVGPRPLLLDVLKERSTKQRRGTPKGSQIELEQETSVQRQGAPKQPRATGAASEPEGKEDGSTDSEGSTEGQSEPEEATPNLASPEELAKPLLAVEKVLFLATRTPSVDTAILLASTVDGCVCAWSICDQGGLLAKFKPTQGEQSVVRAMSTDPLDRILLTGDNNGFIMLWDIQDYCCREKTGAPSPIPPAIPPGDSQEEPEQEEEEQEQEQGQEEEEEVQSDGSVEEQTEMWDGSRISITPPKLLASWQCHLKGITHLQYVETLDLIITASKDCSLCLWTSAGCYIGTFGQVAWRVDKDFLRNLPTDQKGLVLPQEDKMDEEEEEEELYDSAPPEEAAGPAAPAAPAAPADPAAAGGLAGGPVLDLEHVKLCPSQYCSKAVEKTWREWQEKGKESKILGKAYKPKVTHLRLPSHQEIKKTHSSDEALRISQLLTCVPLETNPVLVMPDTLKKQQKKKEDSESQRRKKKKQPKDSAYGHGHA